MPKELWFEKRIPGDYRALSETYGVSPAMARLLVSRLADRAGGVLPSAEQVREYLEPDISVIYSYRELPDIDKAIDILSSMISDEKRIRVIGDYDIDGVCSTYILNSGLLKAGAVADHAIPHRITDGYGLNERLIREAAHDGIDCIITCDNGISASEQIRLAHELGMVIIVTDHHEIPFHMENGRKKEDLPDADAVVDIKREDSSYGFTGLCGAVVAFKVLAALYERLGIPAEEAEEYVELAAFATVGDVMPLRDENRTIVKAGLEALRHTKRPGMKALIRAQGIQGMMITAYHVGFVLGPCINATGRLATAENAYELLAAADDEEGERLALMLVSMNNERKEVTDRGIERALDIADSLSYRDDRVLVIYLTDTHESVAGIIAGRVREKTGKPTFILTDGESGIKGSGRSIDEYDMYEAMTAVSDLFDKYGGHKMAGGLSLKEGVTPEMMKQRLNEVCTLTEKDLTPKIRFDMQLPFSHADADLVSDMKRLEPFGAGNTRPLFALKDVMFRNINVSGRNGNVIKGIASDEYGTSRNFVFFGDADEFCEASSEGNKLKILYYPEINEYRGESTLQMHIQSYC